MSHPGLTSSHAEIFYRGNNMLDEPKTQLAGVAGLPSDSKINGCDKKTAPENPSETLVNPRGCRTSRKRPATPEQRALIAIRVKHGPDTLAGRICSDVVEEFENHKIAKAMDGAFQLSMLAVLMPAKVRELAKLI
jgi:hypothetical protein